MGNAVKRRRSPREAAAKPPLRGFPCLGIPARGLYIVPNNDTTRPIAPVDMDNGDSLMSSLNNVKDVTRGYRERQEGSQKGVFPIEPYDKI